MTLPTNEQLEAKFEQLAHTDKETERVWFWAGIAAYCQCISDSVAKDLNLDCYKKGGQKQ
jgi:hypothetical protein